MTDEELIRMFRSDPTWMGQEVADRIEALVKERDQWIEHTKNAVWSDSEELKLANARIEALVRERDALRLQRAAMHRRAQRAEGKAHRSAHLLETILRSIKESIPMLPTLPSP